MYKYLGIGLLGVFAMMVIPAQGQDVSDALTFYGIANLVVHDAYGNEIMRHTTHNVLVDDGEQFIIDQVFDEGTAAIVSPTIGSMCITGIGSFAPTDGTTAATLDGDSTIGGVTRCHNVTFADISAGVVNNVGAPETFDTTDAGIGVAITGIGICQTNAATFQNCDFTGGTVNFLFAAVALSPTVTLAAGETVDIDYQFSIA